MATCIEDFWNRNPRESWFPKYEQDIRYTPELLIEVDSIVNDVLDNQDISALNQEQKNKLRTEVTKKTISLVLAKLLEELRTFVADKLTRSSAGKDEQAALTPSTGESVTKPRLDMSSSSTNEKKDSNSSFDTPSLHSTSTSDL
ncbi:hypothetical protein G7Y89_g7979 [Cudoniella acicularis]|uniref:Uncharacterized protein n=1 Tax=Cudoniella acicularis TaxID=354080 RepID=A0A8H4RK65_9HELO|nr:hypothetical protein G7Y89_g7979 [Cudoniella acicularis]